MYILTTLEFPKHNFEFHLMTTSVNAKYYYYYTITCLFDIIISSLSLRKNIKASRENDNLY